MMKWRTRSSTFYLAVMSIKKFGSLEAWTPLNQSQIWWAEKSLARVCSHSKYRLVTWIKSLCLHSENMLPRLSPGLANSTVIRIYTILHDLHRYVKMYVGELEKWLVSSSLRPRLLYTLRLIPITYWFDWAFTPYALPVAPSPFAQALVRHWASLP